MTLDTVNWGGPLGAAPVVGGTAAWNGLAFNPYQIWACRRAELTAFAETPFRCSNGERATMAQIRTLPPRSYGLDRMSVVGRRLVDELLPKLQTVPSGSRLGLVLCLSDRFERNTRGKRFASERAALENDLVDRLRQQGWSPLLHTEARGHASLAFAMIEACTALASGALEVALVGGIETYYDPDVIEELLQQGRLFDGENLNSFIPGEGGAFFLIARPDVAKRARWEPLARVESAAAAQEPAPMFAEAPCQAIGLSRALGAIADRFRKERRQIQWWLSDLTNEDYRVHEWQLALPRASAGVSGNASGIPFRQTPSGRAGKVATSSATSAPRGPLVSDTGYGPAR